MKSKRREYLVQRCHDQAIRMITAQEHGALIPRLDVVADIYKILEEIAKACPVEAG